MSRKKRLALNSSTAFLSQIIALACGFVMPSLYLKYYGARIYGLISSVSSILSIISFFELGVGAVVRASMFEPLAQKDYKKLSQIFVSSARFYRRIGQLFILYVAGIVIIYPFIRQDFDFIYIGSVTVILAINTFTEYYFGMSSQILLNADQRTYIKQTAVIITTIVNTLACIYLIMLGCDIRAVKLISAIILLARPVVVISYVKRHYSIDVRAVYDKEPITQKWNGLAQNLAYYVLINTDVIVLTVMSTLENVAIYSLYSMVVEGIKNFLLTFTNSFTSLFGSMIANKEAQKLDDTFNLYEWFVHTVVTLLYSVTATLMIPFIQVYSKKLGDVDYILPFFAFVMCLAQVSYCLRLPYSQMVDAAGHYKQTQTSAMIEAFINIVISVVFVRWFGLAGVAIGTFAAMLYRTIYLVVYLSHHILYRNISIFVKHVAVDAVAAVLISFVTGWMSMSGATYHEWMILAVKTTWIAFVIVVILNIFFYKREARFAINMVKEKITRK